MNNFTASVVVTVMLSGPLYPAAGVYTTAPSVRRVIAPCCGSAIPTAALPPVSAIRSSSEITKG
ncbi:hypothetical protein NG2371_06641 [Nocardia gamkensis]|nr:hypothetical protein [Nocardia gamkensis]